MVSKQENSHQRFVSNWLPIEISHFIFIRIIIYFRQFLVGVGEKALLASGAT